MSTWGVELWDQRDLLEKHTQSAIEFFEKCASFVKERVKIEQTYAKSLRNLVKSYQFKKKEEDDYIRATQLVLTNQKPSALCKELAEHLCECEKTLDGCCAAKTVLAMWKLQLPQQVRTALAGKTLKETEAYKDALKTRQNH